MPEPVMPDHARDSRRRDQVFPPAWREPIGQYVAHVRAAAHSESTLRQYLHYLHRLAADHPSPWSLTSVQLTEFLSVPHWARETRRNARNSLRSFYSWAVSAGHVGIDPSLSLPRIRQVSAAPRPAAEAAVHAALERSSGRDRLMVMLAAYAGLRRAEIAAVHTRDLGRVSNVERGFASMIGSCRGLLF